MTALLLAAAFTLREIGPDVAPTNRIVRRVDSAPIVVRRFADDRSQTMCDLSFCFFHKTK